MSAWKGVNVCVCVLLYLTAGLVQSPCPPAVIWLWQSNGDIIVCSSVWCLYPPMSSDGSSTPLSSSLFLSSPPFCILFFSPLLSMSGESWQFSLMQHYILSSMEMCTHWYTATNSAYSLLLLPYTFLPWRPLTLARWTWRQTKSKCERVTGSKSDWCQFLKKRNRLTFLCPNHREPLTFTPTPQDSFTTIHGSLISCQITWHHVPIALPLVSFPVTHLEWHRHKENNVTLQVSVKTT